MDEIDSLTRDKIREWQIRRLDIKEQMHLNPSKTLELSRVLDLMDEEHAELLSGSKNSQVEGANQREEIYFRAAAAASLSPSTADSTPFGHSAHADPDTCSTIIRTGSRSAATQGWHC